MIPHTVRETEITEAVLLILESRASSPKYWPYESSLIILNFSESSYLLVDYLLKSKGFIVFAFLRPNFPSVLVFYLAKTEPLPVRVG